MPERKIYLLDPRELDPETIAVTFAKTSRSPLSFRDIAAELTQEKSSEFHEKWVVGYGHASVAEHAILHIAVENISRLAVECLESNRLASYTEKSTRYQKWKIDGFHIPSELDGHPLRNEYIEISRKLIQTYLNIMTKVELVARDLNPRQKDENESSWERRIQAQAIDSCRFLLPASALANVGVTINARALEHAIQKMLSDPLLEVQEMGAEIKEAAKTSVPTLVKYADYVPNLHSSRKLLQQAEQFYSSTDNQVDWLKLSPQCQFNEENILAAALFRFGSSSFDYYRKRISELSLEEKKDLANRIFSNLRQFDIPLRELEYSQLIYEIILDQGAFYELKRHRMMTLSAQAFNPDLGYAIPRLIEKARMLKEYCDVMDSAGVFWKKLHAEIPDIAAYILPNGYKRRVIVQMNLRTLDHFLALRSASNAHFSLRRVAQRMAELACEIAPVLGSFLRIYLDETWQEIEAKYFYKT